jgi:hypothetical protein
MPRFHFPIVDGTRLDDPVGVVLSNKTKAAEHAETIARHVSNLGHKKRRNVLALDEEGREVHKVAVQRND